MKKKMLEGDERNKAVNEYFSGIKIIKYYSWENFVKKSIEKIRKREVTAILKFANLRSVIELIMQSTPLFLTGVAFYLYILGGN